MDYLPLPDIAARQLIDAMTVFSEHRRARAEAQKVVGGMYWKRQGAHEYLVKTRPDNQQQRLGPRNADTEHTFEAFTQRKRQAESRLKGLREALKEAERLNKAVKVGRVPNMVVALLNTLDQAGLSPHFTVVGTHALYAYEAAAGVRIVQAALATQDVDLLWDARRRVQFITDMRRQDTSMLQVLQRVDASFRRKDQQKETPGRPKFPCSPRGAGGAEPSPGGEGHLTAINDRGFEVDFLRRMAVDGDPHPFRFSNDEDDLWPVQAARASVLTDAPRFEHVVVSATGKMALMRTIAPSAFVAFKRWMAESAPHRPAMKRRRDLRQATLVQALVDEGMLVPG